MGNCGPCSAHDTDDDHKTTRNTLPKTGFYADDYFHNEIQQNSTILVSSSENKISEEEFSTKYFRLSTPKTKMKESYDAIVIGSGYGGGIAASRLCRAGFNCCILEKGKEWVHGSFPDDTISAVKEIRMHNKNGTIGINNPQAGLFNFYVGNVVCIYAHGLGGTSLMNASVCLEPVKQFWDLDIWPKEIKNEYKQNELKQYWDKAKAYLNPKPYPYKAPNKYNALNFVQESIKENMDSDVKDIEDLGELYRTPLYVTWNENDSKQDDDNKGNDGSNFNQFGVYQEGCVSCGNCFTGCNVSAKNTIDKNFLPDAKSFGCDIFTKCNVTRIEEIKKDENGYKDGYKYRVYFNNGGNKYFGNEIYIKSKIVVVAAGCVGTNEIMIRSSQNGLKLSKHLGKRFSVNGDQFGVVYNSDHKCDVLGWNENPNQLTEEELKSKQQIGTTIVGVVDMRTNNEKYKYENQYVIEDGSPPGIGKIPELFKIALVAGNLLIGEDEQTLQQEIESKIRALTGKNIENTLTVLSMSYDDSSGYFKLNNDNNLEIYFPEASKQVGYNILNKVYKASAVKMNGDFIADPLWNPIIGKEKKGITVHPLGGCFVADDINIGVVNHKGQFFRDFSDEKEVDEKEVDKDENGNYVYSGLYCTDAALIPHAICVNPTYTISTLAERVMFNLLKDYGKIKDINDEKIYDINYKKRKDNLKGSPVYFKPIVSIKKGYNSGIVVMGDEEKGSFSNMVNSEMKWSEECCADIIIHINDSIVYEKYPIFGSLKCNELSSKPMRIINGTVRILNEKEEENKMFKYEFYLSSFEGKRYIVLGTTQLKDDNLYLIVFKSKTESDILHDVKLNVLEFVGRIVLKRREETEDEKKFDAECENTKNEEEENELVKKYTSIFM